MSYENHDICHTDGNFTYLAVSVKTSVRHKVCWRLLLCADTENTSGGPKPKRRPFSEQLENGRLLRYPILTIRVILVAKFELERPTVTKISCRGRFSRQIDSI